MTQSALPDQTQQAAVDWFVRLQGDPDVATWTAFQAWLEADPAHARAYDEVELLWTDLDEVETPPPVVASDNVVPLTIRPRRVGLWLGVGGAIAAALALAVALPTLLESRFTDYATQRGETRVVALADGSRLTLGGATTLRVRLTRGERDVTLVDGEAAFDVAHEAARPFVVTAGDREVRVLGTEFDILNHANRMAVTVRRGLVAVSGDGESVRLAKGQQLTRAKGAGASRVETVDPNAAFAWSKGHLVYQNAPLADVVSDLNRYVSTPIRVDPSAASVKVSGVLSIDEEAAMIRRLELFAPVVSRRGANEIVLTAKPARP